MSAPTDLVEVRIAYPIDFIDRLSRYLGKCPHDDVVDLLPVLRRGGVQVELPLRQAPSQASPQE